MDAERAVIEIMKANPNASREQATEAYLHWLGTQRDVGPTPTEKVQSFLGGGYTAVRDAGRQFITSQLDRPWDPKPQAQSLANIVYPDTAGQAAAQAALALTPGGFLARTGAGMAAGAGAAAVTGGKPVDESVSALLSSLLGTGAAATARGALRLGSAATQTLLRKVSDAFAERFGTALGQDVGAFAGKVRTAEDLLKLRDPAVGMKALRDGMRDFDQTAAGMFGAQEIPIPHTVNTQAGPMTLPVPMKIDAALEKVRELKALARDADPGTLGFDPRQAARDAEKALKQALGAKHSTLLDQYEGAVSDFDKGLDMLAALRKSGLFGNDAKQALVDVPKFQQWARDNFEQFPLSRFPNSWGALVNGGQVGASDTVTTPIAGRIYTHFGPARTGELIKMPGLMNFAGESPVQVGPAAQALATLGANPGPASAAAESVVAPLVRGQ